MWFDSTLSLEQQVMLLTWWLFIWKIILWLMVAYIGAIFGSFLGVIAIRKYQEKENFSFKSILWRSRCDHCKKQIKWYHNIPIFSYLFLRGRCAFCKTKISPVLLIAELAWAIDMVCLVWFFYSKLLDFTSKEPVHYEWWWHLLAIVVYIVVCCFEVWSHTKFMKQIYGEKHQF